MIPGGFDKRIERLTCRDEIGDGLAHQHVQHLAGFSACKIFLGFGAIAAGETGDLIVKRSVHIKQCASDIQQRAFICQTLAVDDFLHRVALLLHKRTRQPETEHAEGVGDALQCFHLRLQRGWIFLTAAQVKIERVFHAQQFFFDRSGNGVKQRAIATSDATAGVVELGFGRAQRIQIEHFTQFHQCRMHRFTVRDVVQQLTGGFERSIGTMRIEAALIEHTAGFAVNTGKGLTQTRAGRHGTVTQRTGDH